MAVPYRRKSKSKSRMRRAANMKYTPVAHVNCEKCGGVRLPHRACGECGYYGGKVVLHPENQD